MTLDEYFHVINKEKQVMMTNDLWTGSNNNEPPATDVYFSIRTPEEGIYPAHSHTMSMQWQDGASWLSIIWEILKVLEASYGYPLKERVFFKVHNEDIIEGETNEALAAQMFVEDKS